MMCLIFNTFIFSRFNVFVKSLVAFRSIASSGEILVSAIVFDVVMFGITKFPGAAGGLPLKTEVLLRLPLDCFDYD